MKVELHKIIKRPIITERSTMLRDSFRQMVFEVETDATKPLIKAAVEKAFSVKVTAVRTMIVHGATRRVGRNVTKNPNWKKAIVTLREGDSIQLVEGV